MRRSGAAVLLASLAQVVWRAREFSHDARYLKLLGDHPIELWLLVASWLALLLVRGRLDAAGTAELFERPASFGAAVAGLLFLLFAPFTNAHFSHLTHPGLAAAAVWVIWPLLERLAAAIWPRLPALGRSAPWLMAAAGFTLIFVQSLRRHLWFGSGGKDLGLFHQSVWLLSRGRSPDNTIMGMNAFADHMELIDVMAAPLQWIWPSASALLLFQASMVALGTVPVFELARVKLGSRPAAVALALVYLLALDQQQAVMFDWNPTTCGVAFIPWVVWSFERERPVAFGLSLAGLALSKENLVLYALALCLTLAIGKPSRRRWPLAAAALLAVFFVVEMKVVMPWFRPDGFRHLRFEGLGRTPVEMVTSVVQSPMRAFALLLTPGRKIDGLLLPFSSVAFACLLAPRFLIALAPVILERFWSTHANRWWGFHYGAGAGVLATIAAIEGLARLRATGARIGRPRLVAGAVVTVLVSCLAMGTLARPGCGPLLAGRHSYTTSAEDRADAGEVLAQVSPEARVAAQNHLLPHLSARRFIHQIVDPLLPEGAGSLEHHVSYVTAVADVVALDLAQDAWPKSPDFVRGLARELLERDFGITACRGSAFLLERGAATRLCPGLDLGL
jgi:uncharacterized membrane protein